MNPIEQTFTKNIWRSVAILMFLIGGFAFAMSFRQLLEAAYAGGKDRLWEYWTFPLLLDGSILLFTLATLWFTLTGIKWRHIARLFVFVFTFLTAVLNYNHATLTNDSGLFLAQSWLSEPQFIAVSAPLVYFLCVEFFVLMLHKKMTISARYETLGVILREVETTQTKLNTLQTEQGELETHIQNLETQKETLMQELSEMSKQYHLSLVWLGMSQAGMSQREIGDKYKRSAATVNKAIASLNGEWKATL